jgi:tRNA(Ile)-lysidine synthetase-like protein
MEIYLKKLAWDSCIQPSYAAQNPILSLVQKKFCALPTPLQRMALQVIYELWHGSTEELSFDHLEHVRTFMLHSMTGKEKRFGKKCLIQNTYAQLLFLDTSQPDKINTPKVSVVIPGETQWNGFTIKTSFRPIKNGLHIVYRKQQKLFVRVWNKGDRFIPFGMKGGKKLQDFFTDLKITKELRTRIPILVDEQNQIVAVYNLRIDDRVKIANLMKTSLYFSIVP